MKPTTTTRGGKRPGAGRKPAGTVKRNYNVRPETHEKIEHAARADGVPMGRVIDKLVEKINLKLIDNRG